MENLIEEFKCCFKKQLKFEKIQLEYMESLLATLVMCEFSYDSSREERDGEILQLEIEFYCNGRLPYIMNIEVLGHKELKIELLKLSNDERSFVLVPTNKEEKEILIIDCLEKILKNT